MILVPSDRARLAVYPSSLYVKIANLLLEVNLFIWTDVEPHNTPILGPMLIFHLSI